MCYPSYNALFLFPLCMFFVWIILGLLTYLPATCFLVSMKWSSLGLAIPAPQYVHVSCFTSYSSFKCELVHHWLKLRAGYLQHLLMHQLEVFHYWTSQALHSGGEWLTPSWWSPWALWQFQLGNCMADRTNTIWMQTCDLRKINYFGSF